MFDPKFFQELAKKVSDNLPPKFNEIRVDIENTLQSLLQQTFTKLDLVTREEFEVQAEVLKRTRIKLEDLEDKVRELEARCVDKRHSHK